MIPQERKEESKDSDVFHAGKKRKIVPWPFRSSSSGINTPGREKSFREMFDHNTMTSQKSICVIIHLPNTSTYHISTPPLLNREKKEEGKDYPPLTVYPTPSKNQT